MSTAGTAAAIVGVEALKKLGGDIYALLKSKGLKQASLIKLHTQAKSLYKHAASVRRVKTIAFLDKAVDLLEFYHPAKIKISGTAHTIHNLGSFETDRNVLIEGIAGQGKSILMRYLCGEELTRGEAIPVFIELRKVSEKKSLRALIGDGLECYKIDPAEDVFEAICEGGKISLLLDGFDEIPESCRLDAITFLEHLSKRFPKLIIVVSSRPSEALRGSPFFSTYSICGLTGNEYEKVITKLLPKGHDILISRTRSNRHNISALLSTPLLVTLLVVTYRSYQEIPDTLSGFYEALFQLLLQRHDGLKPGYQRARRCKISDSTYRSLFDATCYFSKSSEPVVYSKKTLIGFAQKAASHIDQAIDADDYIHDIVKITCLILSEGDEYRFIHKSVQEFYAASFLSGKPDTVIKNFYQKCVSHYHPISMPWENELQFLSEIDRYRYLKFYFLPAIETAMSVGLPSSQWTADILRQKIHSKFEHMEIVVEKETAGWHVRGIPIPNFGPLTMRIMGHSQADAEIFHFKPLPPETTLDLRKKVRPQGVVSLAKFRDLIKQSAKEAAWDEYLTRASDYMLSRIREAQAFILKSEDASAINDFMAGLRM